MNYYETLYIVHPALDAGRVKEMVLSVNNNLEKFGGSLASIDVWGKKKLAYEIDKQKYGTYIFLQYKLSELSNLKELSSEFEHNPNVLRYLNIKIDKEDVFETRKEDDDSDAIDNVKESASDNSDKSKKSEKDKDSNPEEGK